MKGGKGVVRSDDLDVTPRAMCAGDGGVCRAKWENWWRKVSADKKKRVEDKVYPPSSLMA